MDMYSESIIKITRQKYVIYFIVKCQLAVNEILANKKMVARQYIFEASQSTTAFFKNIMHLV